MRKISFFSCLLLLLSTWSCKTSNTPTKSSTLGTIGGDPIYVNDFNYVYNKNNANTDKANTKESIEEYLDLYVNFRLKVKEAESLGLDTAQSFIKELDGYKKQLAKPYLSEKGLTEKFTKEAYERMKEEINASHILLAVTPNADPKDTLEVWKKINDIRQKAIKGEDFGKLALEYSEDPSAKANKGNLGYFTALQMVYPFEDAAYSTPPGSISKPIRTRFGYHILKVNDRRPSQGEIKVSHLMVRATEGISKADSLAAKEKIDELYKKVKAGENWDDLVKQFSDDINTRDKGGELPWFSTGKMIPAFAEAAFALKNPGDISEPVHTAYGWHIIKLQEKKALAPFSDLEAKIKSKVMRDRAAINKKALIARLKEEDNFEEYPLVSKRAFTTASDSSLLVAKWEIPKDAVKESVLFLINGEKFTTPAFFEYVKENQKPVKGISPETYLANLYEDYKDAMLIDYEERHLAEKYPDYKMLVKEYRDGILLFQLMDEKVWSKAISDTAGLRQFFEANREKYKWGERAKAIIFNAKDSATIVKVKKSLRKDFYPANEPALEPLVFEASIDSLDNADKDKLNKLASYLLSKDELSVKLVPETFSKKSTKNALERAEKAKHFLLSRKVDSARILMGSTSMIDNNKKAGTQVALLLLSPSPKSLEKTFNTEPLTLQIKDGVFQKGENKILDKVDWKVDTSVVKDKGRYYLILINEIEAPRLKELDETKGIVISDYQESLEKDWIEKLKKKYPVQIKEEEVQKLITK